MSQKKKITQRFVDTAKYNPSKGRENFYDTEIHGLRFRVNKTSSAYYVYYRMRDTEDNVKSALEVLPPTP